MKPNLEHQAGLWRPTGLRRANKNRWQLQQRDFTVNAAVIEPVNMPHRNPVKLTAVVHLQLQTVRTWLQMSGQVHAKGSGAPPMGPYKPAIEEHPGLVIGRTDSQHGDRSLWVGHVFKPTRVPATAFKVTPLGFDHGPVGWGVQTFPVDRVVVARMGPVLGRRVIEFKPFLPQALVKHVQRELPGAIQALPGTISQYHQRVCRDHRRFKALQVILVVQVVKRVQCFGLRLHVRTPSWAASLA